jgi:hypothetical protein
MRKKLGGIEKGKCRILVVGQTQQAIGLLAIV